MSLGIRPALAPTSETLFVCITGADGSKRTAVAAVDPDSKTREVAYLAPDGSEIGLSPGDVVAWGKCTVECTWLSADTVTAAGSLSTPPGAVHLHAQNRSGADVEYSRDGVNWKVVQDTGTFYVRDADGLNNLQIRPTGGGSVNVVVDYYGN